MNTIPCRRILPTLQSTGAGGGDVHHDSRLHRVTSFNSGLLPSTPLTNTPHLRRRHHLTRSTGADLSIGGVFLAARAAGTTGGARGQPAGTIQNRWKSAPDSAPRGRATRSRLLGGTGQDTPGNHQVASRSSDSRRPVHNKTTSDC